MAFHIPVGPLKTRLGWSQYRDANSVPTSPFSHCVTGPVYLYLFSMPIFNRLSSNKLIFVAMQVCEVIIS